MIPKPAQYLLRFDDLCPTISRTRWQRFLPIIERYGVKPILAVIPDNMDRKLVRSRPYPEFWEEMRAMEAAGATIALHGYRHLCQSMGKSLVPLHPKTEFAGLAEDIQRHWINTGLTILRGHGLNPRIFVAPRHGFDRTTIRVLRKEGIKIISDGFAHVPFKRGGITWIPQQLWGPEEKRRGLWTICVHSNNARSSMVNQLGAFLHRNGAQFTSVDRILAEYRPTELGMSEKIYGAIAIWLARRSQKRKRMVQSAKDSKDD
jgi:predicted deacetylase